MQLNKVLKEKQPSMKREIFAKSPHFIGGLWGRITRNVLRSIRGNQEDGLRVIETKTRIHSWIYPKVNTGILCLKILLCVISANRVSIVGFAPRIVATPTP